MKTRTWMLTAICAGCTLASVAAAQQVDPEAKRVLAEAAQSVGKVESMTYSVKKNGTGALKDIIDIKGEVKFWRPVGSKSPMVYVKGTVKNPGSPDRLIECSYDGTNITWLDWTKNTRFQRPMSDMSGHEDADMSKQLILPEFLTNNGFQGEMNMATVKKRASEKVNDEMCDVVVSMPSVDRETIWSISVADRLPRRFEQGMPGTTQLGWVTNISNLKTGVNFTPKDFEVPKPPGFVDDLQAMGPAVMPAELGIKLGSAVPDFKATDTMGKQQSLDSYKGEAVVLQFFGTMFKASTAACAQTQDLVEDFRDRKVAFFGVSCRELSDTASAEFWKGNKFTYPLIAKGGDDIAKSFKVMGFPTLVVIGQDGKMVAFFQDNPDKNLVAEAIRKAMPH